MTDGTDRKRVNLFLTGETSEFIAVMTARLGLSKGEVVDWMAKTIKENEHGEIEDRKVCGR